MAPIMLTIILKGIGMILALVGGIIIAKYGYHLYKSGAGSGRGKIAFEYGNFKLKAHSVGSVIMATAFLWAGVAVLLSPNLDKKGENYRIYSFQISDVSLNMPSFSMPVSQSELRQVKQDSQKLKELLSKAIVESSEATNYIQLNGKPASIDISTINVFKQDSGNLLLTSEIQSDNKTVKISFKPAIMKQQISFVPTGFETN